MCFHLQVITLKHSENDLHFIGTILSYALSFFLSYYLSYSWPYFLSYSLTAYFMPCSFVLVCQLVSNISLYWVFPGCHIVGLCLQRMLRTMLVFTSRKGEKSPAPRGALPISRVMRRIKMCVGAFYIRYTLSYQDAQVPNVKSIAFFLRQANPVRTTLRSV